MSSNKKYWKSVEELDENSSIVKTLQQNEFVEELPVDEFLGDKDKSTKDLTVPEFDQFLKDIDRYFSVEWSMKLPRDEDLPKTMIKDEHKT